MSNHSKTITPEKIMFPKSNYVWEDSPDPAKFSECVHCGMCLEACPTYQQTGLEAHSPRGRVYLIKSVAEGKLELNDFFADPVNTCLDCRACETACPSGVQVGALVEEARGQLYKADPPSGFSGFINKLFLRGLFPYASRMRILSFLTRFYQRSGLRYLARGTSLLRILPKHLQEMERALPDLKAKPVLGRVEELLAPIGTKRARVAVLTGCVMDAVFADINEATINVLRHNGCEVWIPQNQSCCGALHVHAGDRDMAKQLAKQNIDTFLSEEIDAVIINAAGCGSTLKEYGELLKSDPEYAGKAHLFAEKTIDVSSFLDKLGLIPPKGELDMTITYHDACHLAHAQGIRVEPRRLLESVSGIKLVPLPDSDRCCGSAGIYNLTHPEMAGELLDRKMADLPSGCDAVVMGNPGCMMQFMVGVVRHDRSEQILHTVQLLDWAYREQGVKLSKQPDKVGRSEVS
ncbi:glycolate oxidase iron-sulfur subunit [Paenibacillus sp. 1_12]|uniref:(Fe-S)-binding protein n=1 Tax=Paenibacillus sp. 1_12 TaxID=1566278 RepID=UPI0008E85F2E|nr:(Fe-S)-binding protein [Paenibacillus sp. 1_12]SFL01005.1 glycolate oxidase iron-sulfur subunit [Paenibacillus sp. 1_12]